MENLNIKLVMCISFFRAAFFLSIVALFATSDVLGQTITVGSVDPGPYAPGSTIGVPISVTGNCADTSTKYNLYLSDASGNFANQTLIGSFSNFYATFVNGVIPAGTVPGTGYEVKVTTTGPVVTSAVSSRFTITSGSGVIAGVSSQPISSNYLDVFGQCNGSGNTNFSFVDKSTIGSTVTATFYNELSQTAEAIITPTSTGTNFSAAAAQYSVFVKATNGGIVGTKIYFLINNPVNNSFGVTGNNAVCLKNGAAVQTYNVDINSSNGLQKNFPGLIYTINWGDGFTTSFTYCQILAAGGKISHTYITSSCGNSPNGQNNAFEVDLQPNSPYCGKVGTQVTSYAQVVTAPENRFESPMAACLDSVVIFNNISDPGQTPSNTQKDCKSLNALYTWSVDGVTVASNYTDRQPFQYRFTTTGTHSVTLHLQNGSTTCNADDVTHYVCIQVPPKPQFSLPTTTGCAPSTITPTDLSIVDANCNSSNQYVWTVTGPGSISYGNGTTANSTMPQFIFNTPGVYQVQLGILTASCGMFLTKAQTIYIDGPAAAKLSPDTTLCGGNQTLNFNANAGPTQAILTGSAANVPGAYSWTVSGGNYAFTGGTSDTSKYPQIIFKDLTTYTISVIAKSSCGAAVSSTQHITFNDAPVISAGPSQKFCANQGAKLQGTVTGVVGSTMWAGGNGSFTPSRSSLTPTYFPSAAEIAAGSVTLTLIGTTAAPKPCDKITSSVSLTISSPDSVTSQPAVSSCNGTALNYQIAASVPNSTFTWTVDQNNTTASARGYTISGSGSVITDILTNSDPSNDAIVTYNIIAAQGTGCGSNVFVLTVHVAPKTVITKFSQDVSSGCDSLKVNFLNQSTPANSAFVWNFGDGSPLTNVVNPTHIFAPRLDGKDTTYTITLSIASSCVSTTPFTSKVTVSPKVPVAFITPESTTGCSPYTITVDNFSPGTNQSYDYFLYDGATLVQQITAHDKKKVTFNPVTVKASNTFSVYMIVTGPCGATAKSNIIPITISPTNIIAQTFIDNGIGVGCTPFTPTFINNSAGGDTYTYNIYDANKVAIDHQQAGTAPFTYTFKNAGTFYVSVTGTNNCSFNESVLVKIVVYPIPNPQFLAVTPTGCKQIKVSFTNKTADTVGVLASSLSYDWDFGDGSAHVTSFTPPIHTYSYKNSPYTVVLKATNTVTNCSNSLVKTAYITVNPPPSTAFAETPDSITTVPSYHFNFADETKGGATAWTWNFGDGQTSTSQNPGHTYIDTGYFKVTLTAFNQAGCDSTVTHRVRINGVPGQLYMPNAFEPGSTRTDLNIFIAKGGGMKSYHIQVFNGYSQLMWESTKLDATGAPAEGWDGTFQGKPMPQGVYIWQASASFINGTEWKGNVIGNSAPARVGTIHLIR